jgi:UDP-N-acetylglucosamine 2-epimerase
MEAHGIKVSGKVHIIPPLAYLDMLALLERASVLITDSGGLQKEAYVLQVPCVTVRPDTEWPETIESGWNRLIDAHAEEIQRGVREALGTAPTEHLDYYGTGDAAEKIVAALETTSQLLIGTKGT